MEIPMRRRLYYVLPDIDSARRTMDDLLLARIEVRHIHFLGKRGTAMDGLQEASFLQKSDIVHAAQRGLLVGAGLGCVGGLLLMTYVVTAPAWHIATVFLSTAFGAGFGGWTSSLVGASIPNSRLRQFADEIENGKFLLMVDVPEHRIADVKSRVGAIHPEALDRGVEVNVPVFP
jgi:hypothetical protein